MDPPLAGEEGNGPILLPGVHTIVPCVGVEVDSFPCRDQKCAHVLRPHVVAVLGEPQTDHKRDRARWEEELGAVWVVIGHPKEDGVAATSRVCAGRRFWNCAEPIEIGVVHAGNCEIFAVKEVTLPVDLEVALCGPRLIPCVRVELPPPL